MDYLEKSFDWFQSFHKFLLSSNEWGELVDVLKLKTSANDTMLKIRENHYHAATKCFDRPPLLLQMLKAINQFEHQLLGLPSYSRLFDKETRKLHDELSHRGFSTLPQVDAKTVAEMKHYFENQMVMTADEKLVPLDQFSGANVAEFPASTVARCPHLLRLASDAQLLSAVERYLGAIPTVVVMSAWWSLANKQDAKEAQFFHFDYDDYKFCKLFIYLTDVDMDCGPHVYMEGTHRFEEVMQARQEWMSEVTDFDKFYVSTLRKSDETVKRYFKKEPHYFVGPAGSSFLVDTRGIHKGLLPKDKMRLICQVTYGVCPTFQQQIDAVRVDQLPRPERDILSEAPTSYTFRLFVDQAQKLSPTPQTPTHLQKSVIQSENPIILENKVDGWTKIEDCLPFLQTLVPHETLRNRLQSIILSSTRVYSSLYELADELVILAKSESSLNLSIEDRNTLMQLVQDWRARFSFTKDAFKKRSKPNPAAVFWPNPAHSQDQSIYNTLPFVHQHPLVNKQTKIGSAGSCFAFELSYGLQERGFNYLITERGHRPTEGVYIDSYDPGRPLEKFSASWGILFNSPSFAQTAEHAFGHRDLPKFLVKNTVDNTDLYIDPFREGVFFSSQKAYELDRESHRAASRRALQEAEVFVVTMGLNECWEVMGYDCFLSRNPNSLAVASMLRHRVLTVEDNIRYMNRFISIVKNYNPNIKILLSVSPIPFLATARANDMHVVEANSHSKAVLRVAAHELCKQHKNVFYFPSYELVTTCTMDPWDSDHRHVKPDTVKKVLHLFDKMFVVDSNHS